MVNNTMEVKGYFCEYVVIFNVEEHNSVQVCIEIHGAQSILPSTESK